METNNFTKALGIFLLGWTLSGFGLAQFLGFKPTVPQQTNKSGNTTGLPLKLTFSLINASDNTGAKAGLRVDFVQCTPQQPYNGNSYNCQPLLKEGKNTVGNPAIRQSQFTNENGLVTFTANYPDKYAATTTHFHVMVYDRFNTLVTASQFDFPEVVYPTMGAYYAAGGKNPATILINDPTANPPLLVTGNAISGFVGSRSIFIPENTSGMIQYETGGSSALSNLKNFPNPVVGATTFAFHLTQASEVEITVTDQSGTQVKNVYTDNLMAGAHEIEVDLGGLLKGIYFYKLQVSNNNGTYSEAKKLLKV